MKKFFTFLILLAFGTFQSIAQHNLTGKITDEKGNPVGFANVVLQKAADSSFISGTVAAENGSFILKTPAAGRYNFKISMLGFTPQRTPAFEVSGPGLTKDFGNIILLPAAQSLKEVTVQTLRPTITQLADRMVVSVEGTALGSGNTAYDVLAKTPGVFVDQDGNIQLNGRSGVTVMLDNKLTYLSGRELRTLLESMLAENLKNIEIITNPSARYDAEGSSGMLNINLKKNETAGMNGSVYSGYTYNFKQHIYNAGSNLNYKIGNWNSFMSVDVSKRAGGREATFTRIFYAPEKTTYFNQTAVANYYNIGPPVVRLGSDYSITKNHSVGFMANYNTNDFKEEFLTETYLANTPGQPYQFINADNFRKNRYANLTTNLHYTGKLDTSGTTLTSDLDFVKINNNGEADFLNYYTDLSSTEPTRQDFLYTKTTGSFDIFSVKADYARPFHKNHKLETGAKASRVASENDARFYFNNGPLVLDPLRSNTFHYTENIYAAYANLNSTLNSKISVQGGLRLEQTQSEGNSLTTQIQTKRSYTNLFPSLFLQQKVSENYGINYSYSRRIQRPHYGNLNPFISYRDPYTLTTGNPYLRPQFTHAFSVSQTFKQTYNLVMAYQLLKDVMSEVPVLDVSNNITTYYTGNVNDGHNASITAIIPYRVMKNWESQNTLVAFYNRYSMTTLNQTILNEQVSYSIQSNHTIQLPKKFRAECSFLFRGPQASGLYHMAGVNWVDVSLRKSLLKEKLEITLVANDIFKGYRYKWTTNIGENVNDFNQYFRFQAVGLRLRYNFSKGQKIDTRRRNNSLEELNRT